MLIEGIILLNSLKMTQEPPKCAGEERGSMGRSCRCDQKQDNHRDSYHLVLAALEQAAEAARIGGQLVVQTIHTRMGLVGRIPVQPVRSPKASMYCL